MLRIDPGSIWEHSGTVLDHRPFLTFLFLGSCCLVAVPSPCINDWALMTSASAFITSQKAAEAALALQTRMLSDSLQLGPIMSFSGRGPELARNSSKSTPPPTPRKRPKRKTPNYSSRSHGQGPFTWLGAPAPFPRRGRYIGGWQADKKCGRCGDRDPPQATEMGGSGGARLRPPTARSVLTFWPTWAWKASNPFCLVWLSPSFQLF